MSGSRLTFPDGSEGKESACSAEDTGDTGSIPGSGRYTMSRSGESAEALLGGGAGERQLFCRVVTVLRRKIKQAKRTGKKILSCGRGSNRHRGGTAEASGAGAE